MFTVHVLLSGRLKLDGYGHGHVMNDDTTFRLALRDGSTVRDVIGGRSRILRVTPEVA